MNGLQTVRAKVRSFNPDIVGDPDSVKLGYYPSLTEREVPLHFTNATQLKGFQCSDLRVGEPLIVAVDGNKVLCAARPSKAFNIEGLRCVTGVVLPDSANRPYEKLVKVRENGEDKILSLSTLTECFQAQQDSERRNHIYNGLREGNSVNLFIGAGSCPHVHYFSVNFR